MKHPGVTSRRSNRGGLRVVRRSEANTVHVQAVDYGLPLTSTHVMLPEAGAHS